MEVVAALVTAPQLVPGTPAALALASSLAAYLILPSGSVAVTGAAGVLLPRRGVHVSVTVSLGPALWAGTVGGAGGAGAPLSSQRREQVLGVYVGLSSGAPTAQFGLFVDSPATAAWNLTFAQVGVLPGSVAISCGAQLPAPASSQAPPLTSSVWFLVSVVASGCLFCVGVVLVALFVLYCARRRKAAQQRGGAAYVAKEGDGAHPPPPPLVAAAASPPPPSGSAAGAGRRPASAGRPAAPRQQQSEQAPPTVAQALSPRNPAAASELTPPSSASRDSLPEQRSPKAGGGAVRGQLSQSLRPTPSAAQAVGFRPDVGASSRGGGDTGAAPGRVGGPLGRRDDSSDPLTPNSASLPPRSSAHLASRRRLIAPIAVPGLLLSDSAEQRGAGGSAVAAVSPLASGGEGGHQYHRAAPPFARSFSSPALGGGGGGGFGQPPPVDHIAVAVPGTVEGGDSLDSAHAQQQQEQEQLAVLAHMQRHQQMQQQMQMQQQQQLLQSPGFYPDMPPPPPPFGPWGGGAPMGGWGPPPPWLAGPPPPGVGVGGGFGSPPPQFRVGGGFGPGPGLMSPPPRGLVLRGPAGAYPPPAAIMGGGSSLRRAAAQQMKGGEAADGPGLRRGGSGRW